MARRPEHHGNTAERGEKSDRHEQTHAPGSGGKESTGGNAPVIVQQAAAPYDDEAGSLDGVETGYRIIGMKGFNVRSSPLDYRTARGNVLPASRYAAPEGWRIEWLVSGVPEPVVARYQDAIGDRSGAAHGERRIEPRLLPEEALARRHSRWRDC